MSTTRGKALKQCVNVGAFEKACLGWSDALDGNPSDLLTDGQTLGRAPGEVLEEADEHGTPMIPRAHVVAPLLLEKLKKPQHPIDGQIVEPQP